MTRTFILFAGAGLTLGAAGHSEEALAHSTHATAPTCANESATLDADFPTGAFATCEATGDRRFKLTIAPEDDGNINCSAWYAFRLTPPAGRTRRTRITVDLDYTRCGHRYWPKTSTDGVTWDYLPQSRVMLDGDEGNQSASISIRVGSSRVFVAGQEILPPAAYNAWLDGVSASADATRSLLGKSAEGRDIPVLRIAATGGAQRESVVLVGRQHPPEVTGALAMLPFVETLLDNNDLAQRYRARFETIVVPILNPDGVMRGHWRHNTGGVDLNRDWGPFTQPETTLMKGVFDNIAADPDRHLRLMLDFHSTQRDIFYTIPDELPTDPVLFTRDWLARFQERMPDYEVKRDARHTVGRPISKAYVFDTYGVPGVTFELGDETDRELIQQIGREAAIAMMETLLATEPK